MRKFLLIPLLLTSCATEKPPELPLGCKIPCKPVEENMTGTRFPIQLETETPIYFKKKCQIPQGTRIFGKENYPEHTFHFEYMLLHGKMIPINANQTDTDKTTKILTLCSPLTSH
jgi:hypothetical protein